MFDLNDINVIEGNEDVSELEYYQALQRAINSGMWSLQGSYGRVMMDALQMGRCLLGLKSARDYWGNRIPSRIEVKDGTMGSWEYVKQQNGVQWATDMAKVK